MINCLIDRYHNGKDFLDTLLKDIRTAKYNDNIFSGIHANWATESGIYYRSKPNFNGLQQVIYLDSPEFRYAGAFRPAPGFDNVTFVFEPHISKPDLDHNEVMLLKTFFADFIFTYFKPSLESLSLTLSRI